MKPFKLAQITDLHLLQPQGGDYRGVDTRQRLLTLLPELQAWQPDLLVLTGDLAQDEAAATYTWLVEQLNASGLRWTWVPGNHDAPALMQAHHPVSWQHTLHGGWQLLGLNTHWPGQVAGRLSADQWSLLNQALQTAEPLIIALHHPPCAVGTEWIDALRLDQGEAVWQALTAANKPILLLAGHVHQAIERQVGQVHLFTCPASSVQFAVGASQFALDLQASAGYRQVLLHPNGQWYTQVVRCPAPDTESDAWREWNV